MPPENKKIITTPLNEEEPRRGGLSLKRSRTESSSPIKEFPPSKRAKTETNQNKNMLPSMTDLLRTAGVGILLATTAIFFQNIPPM